MMMRTYSAKPKDIIRDWYVIDAEGKSLGRIASVAAQIIRGKHKPTFTYNQDVGDFVIVINADKLKLTGNKGEDLVYSHSMYPGGLKSVARQEVLDKHADKLVRKAVWGMTPKTHLGASIIKKLKVYRGSEHPHAAQEPKMWEG